MVRPSMKKGRVTMALVAPTYFMISISRRRAKTLRRMVLPTVMMLTIISTAMMACPPLVTTFWISTKVLVISTGADTLYTPGMVWNCWLMADIWLRSLRETR